MQHPNREDLIQYPINRAPDPGHSVKITEGVYWLRMPLPFALSHINLWLLNSSDGWDIVDTGVSNKDTRAVWKSVLSERMRNEPVNRVFVTHMHPDHAGSAGWLCDELDADLWMSREEYFLCRILTADTGREAPDAGMNFYHAAGFPPDAMHRYHEMFGMFGRLVSALPDTYMRLHDGDNLRIADHNWTVIVGRGHSPEHACLYCPDSNILISGDQLLPKISSNVSVFPTEPAANPLADWLTSLGDMKKRIPADVLVLPAHGKPFHGAHARLTQLMDEHYASLELLQKHCHEPRRAVDTFPALFKAEIRGGNLTMATGESIAHLNYLIVEGLVERFTDDAGIHWYHSKA